VDSSGTPPLHRSATAESVSRAPKEAVVGDAAQN